MNTKPQTPTDTTSQPLRRTAGGIPRFQPIPKGAALPQAVARGYRTNPELMLSHDQAQAVYSAMCALNNVSGYRFSIELPLKSTKVRVWEGVAGHVLVDSIDGYQRETYSDQATFFAAYGLADEYQNAVQAAAGGMTQTAIER